VAAKSAAARLLHLEQHAVALGACDHRRLAEALDARGQGILFLRDLHFNGHFFRDVRRVRVIGRPGNHADQQRRDVAQWQLVIDVHVVQRALRHRRKQCVGRILHDRHASEALDRR
jgi:hypothetical protein